MLYDNSVRKVELRFSATDLINKDLFSLSDPFLVCHTVKNGEPHAEIGRTETVQDDLNPVWATTFSFDYDPSLHHSTSLVVDLFDKDSNNTTSLSKHDFLGRATFRLSELLQSTAMRLDLPLRPASTLLPTTSTTSSSITEDDEFIDHSQQPPTQPQPQPQTYEIFNSIGAKQYDEEYDGSSSQPSGSAQYSSIINSHPNTDPTLSFTYFGNQSSSPSTKTKQRNKTMSIATPPPPVQRKRTNRISSSYSSNEKNKKDIPTSASCDELKRATRGSRASKVKGKVTIYAETLQPTSDVKIKLRVRSALLKDVSTIGSVFGGFKVVQFYEIQRERNNNGDIGVWNCIYRSEDGVKVDKNNYVVFKDISIDEGVLTNMKNDRKLRIAFYKRHTRSKHQLISYVITTLNNLRKGTTLAHEIEKEEHQSNVDHDLFDQNSNDFQNRRKTLMQRKFAKSNGLPVVDGSVTLKMEGEFGDDDGLGSVVIKRLYNSSGFSSPHISNSAVDKLHAAYYNDSQNSKSSSLVQFEEQGFSLRADHFLNRKFVSSLNDAPKYERRIFQKPGFISLH